jgi:hypothetical protein
MTTSNQQVSFSSQLMQNYRLAKPVSAGSQIVAVANASDPTAVFSIANGHVFYIFSDPTSDTGWNITDLQFPGTAVYLAATFIPTTGVFSVIAADANNNLYGTAGPSWPASWGKSTVNLPTGVNVGQLKYAATPSEPYALAFMQNAGTIFQTYLSGSDPPQFFWEPLIGNPNAPVSDWCPGFITAYGPVNGNFPGVFAITNATNATQIGAGVVTNAGNPWTSSDLTQNAAGPYTKVAAAYNPQGSADLFAINGSDSGVYYLSGVSASASNYTALKVSGDIVVSAIAAGYDDKGNSEVFALNTSNTLYHTRQTLLTTQHAAGWSDFLPLNETLKFTQLAVSHNPNGYSDVFAVTTTDELFHIWQEPLSDEWHFDKIKTPQVGAAGIEEYNTYTVQLTVFDSNYVIAPNAAVTISSDQPVTIEINNQSVSIDTNSPWQGASNAAGQVTLTMKTGTLGVPPLSVWTTGMPSGDTIVVDASGPISAQLATIDDAGQALLKAQVNHPDGTQTDLLDKKYSSDSQLLAQVAQAVQTTISLAVNQPSVGTANSPFLHARNDGRVARHVTAAAGFTPQMPAGGIPDQHYEVDFSTDRPVVFRALTAEEAEQLIADGQALPPLFHFFGFTVDWGDVFNAIKDGLAKVAKFVVTTITDGVKFSMHLVIDNIKYAWDTVLEYGITFVQKAFDLVQEVFEKVKVTFDHLFGWLGYIFDWNDILRTRQVIHYTVEETFKLIEQSIDHFKTLVDNNVSHFETWISNNFSNAIANFGGTNTLLQYQTANNVPNPQAAALGSTNVMFTGLLNNANSAQIAADGHLGVQLTDDVTAKLNELMTQVGTYVSGLQSTTAFTNAVTYFEQIGASPDTAFQSLISGLMSLMEGLLLAAIEGLTALFNLLCEATKHIVHYIHEALKAEWQIPFVSEFYQHLTQGTQISALDVLSLALAIPATAFYKLVYVDPPFGAPADVTTFEQNFTAANILNAWGIGPTTTASEAAVSDTVTTGNPAATVDTWTQFFEVAYSAAMFCYAPLEAVVDYQPPVPGAPINPILGLATFGCEMVLAGTSVPPLTVQQAGFTPGTADAAENWMWVFEVADCLIDAGFLLVKKNYPAAANDFGVCVDTAGGVLDLGIAIYRTTQGDIDAGEIAQDFLLTVPEIAKILRLSRVVTATKGVSIPVLAGIDVLMDEAVCFINLFTIKNSQALAASKSG